MATLSVEMRRFYPAFIFLYCIAGLNRPFAQAPNISYSTPQTYNVGTAISALTPSNTGGAVPATIYGQTTTFAGSGSQGSANGAGTAASFDHPYGSCIDAAGNIYVADTYNHLVRKITPAKVVTTFAGSGSPGYVDATGTSASFNNPGGLAIDATGNVYVGDQTNNVIRKITPAGVVSTFAGNGAAAFLNGNGTSSSFNSPAGIAIDGSGNLYIADRTNNMIRKITPVGVVTTFAGDGSIGNTNGPGTSASFSNPTGVAVDANGNVFVTDQNNYLIRKITPAGVVTTLAGTGGQGSNNGLSTSASFNKPFGLAVDQVGNVYVADEFNQLVREITPSGYVNTLAGTGVVGSADGVGTAVGFNYPAGLVSDGQGNLYVTETLGFKIRKLVTTGYAIDKALPAGLTFDPATGTISGTPTASSPATNYTVTAYNATGSSTAGLNIKVSSATPQTITFPAISNKVYGNADFDPSATASSALSVAYSSSNTAVATITAGGLVHIVGVGTVTITANQAGDATYAAAAPVSRTFTVTPAPLTITPTSFSKVYGAALPTLTVTYTGFVNGETSAVLTTPPTLTTGATQSSGVNLYQIFASGAVAANYTITPLIGTLTITPATLTVVPDNLLKSPGTPNPTLTWTYQGFVNGDGTSVVFNPPILSTTATVASPPGAYPITAIGGVAQNYTLAYVAGTLTVIPGQTITFAALPPKTYGDADFNLTATASSGLAVNYTSGNTAVATVSASGVVHIVSAGNTVITASQPGSTNFSAATPVSRTLTVNPAPLTITADNQTRIYNVPNPVLTLTYTGFVNGETTAVLSTQPVVTTAALINSNVGTYPITVSGAVGANYAITHVAGTFTITKAGQTIIFNGIPNQRLGDPNINLVVSASSGMAVTVTSSDPLKASVSGLIVTLIDTGTVTLTATQPGDINYSPATATQTFKIEKMLIDLVLVHPLVTPNGDGINDFLQIEGIEKYPDNKLTIVNKNGVKVYEVSGYDNAAKSFNGYSSITDTPQPQGTYFYQLQFTVNGQTQKRLGYIVLKY